jgi:hypothetical protein
LPQPKRIVRIVNAATDRTHTNRNRAKRLVAHGQARWIDAHTIEFCADSRRHREIELKVVVDASRARYIAGRLSKATMEDLKHTPVVMAHKLYRVGNDRMPVRPPRLKAATVQTFADGVIATTVERLSKVEI